MNDDEPETDDAGDEEGTHQVLLLPNTRVEGLWESLILEDGVKSNLLDYSTAALRFSDVGVDENIISVNRVLLMHGPPGTGKTSLCKALSHKLAIRLSPRYSSTQLLEINSHSLFSKWFSESGKKVMNLFEHIQECCDDADCLVCVLVDEVESLTSARQNAIGNGEPGDALRVVNAMLTGLDKLRRFKNVIILTTTNMMESAVDVAFLDRADIKQYIGPPNQKACYNILRSCLIELVRVGIITNPDSQSTAVLWDYEMAARHWDDMGGSDVGINKDHNLLRNVATVASSCEMSGRILRKCKYLVCWFCTSPYFFRF